MSTHSVHNNHHYRHHTVRHHETSEEEEETSLCASCWPSTTRYAHAAICGKHAAWVTFALLGAALLGIAGAVLEQSFDRSEDFASPLRFTVAETGAKGHLWSVCYALAIALALYPLARAVSHMFLDLLRLPLFTSWYVVILYVEAWENGPLTTLLWGVAVHEVALKHSGLPALGLISTRILIALVVAGVADGLKNVVVAALHGRAIVEQFTAKVQSAIQRLVLLQNFSTAAVGLARQRKALLARFMAAQEEGAAAAGDDSEPQRSTSSGPITLEGDAPIGQFAPQVAVVADLEAPPPTGPPGALPAAPTAGSGGGAPGPTPRTVVAPPSALLSTQTSSADLLMDHPNTLAITDSDGIMRLAHLPSEGGGTLRRRPPPRDAAAAVSLPARPTDVSPTPVEFSGAEAIVVGDGGGPEVTSSPTPDVDVADLRDFEGEEDGYFVLAQYIEAGKFSLFSGRGRVVNVRNPQHAKRIMNGLFSALDITNSNHITREQLSWGGDGWDTPLGPGWSEESVEGAFTTLGMANGVSFSREDLLRFTESAVGDFFSMRGTLSTYSAVTEAIRLIAGGVYYIAMLAFILVLFQIEVSTVLLSLGTLLVSVSFAIGQPASRMAEALLFLLVTQPFDVGDRVRVDGGAAMYVRHIDIYTTTFQRLDGTLVTLANHILSASEVRNEKRGGYSVHEINLNIALDTTPQQLERLNAEVVSYVRARPSSWVSGVIECYIYSADPARNSMLVSFWLKHRLSFQQVLRVFGDKSAFILFLLRTMKQLGIQYSMPHQPVDLVGNGVRPPSALPLANLPATGHPEQPMDQSGPPTVLSGPAPVLLPTSLGMGSPPNSGAVPPLPRKHAENFPDIMLGSIATLWRKDAKKFGVPRSDSDGSLSTMGGREGGMPTAAEGGGADEQGGRGGLRQRGVAQAHRGVSPPPLPAGRTLSDSHQGRGPKKISLTHMVPHFAGISFAPRPESGSLPRETSFGSQSRRKGRKVRVIQEEEVRKSSSAGDLAGMAAAAPPRHRGRASPHLLQGHGGSHSSLAKVTKSK